MFDPMADSFQIPDLSGVIQGPQVKSLLARADEFRRRLIRLSVVLITIWAMAFFYAKELLNFLKEPLTSALPGANINLHFTGPLEVFVSYLHVSFMAAFLVSLPYTLLQIWGFFAPALSPQNKTFVGRYVTASLLLFIGGMLFCYFAMLPPALGFLVGAGRTVATPLITVGDYTSLVLYMMLGMGAVSELPVVLMILERIGFVSLNALKNGRRYAIVVILIVAAIVTPTPDPVSQLIMAAPMYLLYEAAILMIALQKRNTPNQALVNERK
jgi:sec-independent protein translocase protein TatC